MNTSITCANCGASLLGEYCHECGLKRDRRGLASGSTLWKAMVLLLVGFAIDSPVNYAAMLLTFALS